MKIKYLALVIGMIVFVDIKGAEANSNSNMIIEDVTSSHTDSLGFYCEPINDADNDDVDKDDADKDDADKDDDVVEGDVLEPLVSSSYHKHQDIHDHVSDQHIHFHSKPHRLQKMRDPMPQRIILSMKEGALDAVEDIPKILIHRPIVRAVDALIDKGVEYWQEYWKTGEQKQAEQLFFQKKFLHNQLLEHKLECAAIEQSIKSTQVALDCCDPDSPQAAMLKAQLKQKVDMVIILNMNLGVPKLKIIDPETLTDENTFDSNLDDAAEEELENDESNHDVLPAA